MAIPQPLEQRGTSLASVPTVTGIARRLGWLDDPGLAGAVDEQPNATALWSRAQGAPTRLVALGWVDVCQLVLACDGAGIETPAQLAGRRLALPQRDGDGIDLARASARRGLHAAISLAGLFPDEVAWVDVPAGDGPPYAAETAALRAGAVDAIFASGPHGWTLAGGAGLRVVVDVGAHLAPMVRANAATPMAFTADAATLARAPERVVRALAALLRAAGRARRHADAVAAAAAELTGATPAAIAGAYGGALHERLGLDLSVTALAGVAWQKDFLLTCGLLARDVDVAAWADPAPLAAARELVGAA